MIRVLAILLLLMAPALARDDGRYANTVLKSWFDGLRSGNGPCCSAADGETVLDADWDTVDGHYRVRLDGQWIDVPEQALLNEPNLAGRTVVWPMRSMSGVSIRCFLPGQMS